MTSISVCGPETDLMISRIFFFVSAAILSSAAIACSSSSSSGDDSSAGDASTPDGSTASDAASDSSPITNDSGSSPIVDAGADVVTSTNNCTGDSQVECFNAGNTTGITCPADFPITIDCCNGSSTSLEQCQDGGPTVVGDNTYYCCQ